MREIALVFHRFQTPHIGTAIILLFQDQIEKWSLGITIISVTADSASDMNNSISELHTLLKNLPTLPATAR